MRLGTREERKVDWLMLETNKREQMRGMRFFFTYLGFIEVTKKIRLLVGKD